MTCHYCHRPAVVLCDHVTDRTAHPALTCARPLCEVHRKRAGGLLRLTRRNTGGNLTIDYCPEHAGKLVEAARIEA